MEIELGLAIGTAIAAALAVGHFLGCRSEAAYWRDHGDHGGSVHSAGAFYRVVRESEDEHA